MTGGEYRRPWLVLALHEFRALLKKSRFLRIFLSALLALFIDELLIRSFPGLPNWFAAVPLGTAVALLWKIVILKLLLFGGLIALLSRWIGPRPA